MGLDFSGLWHLAANRAQVLLQQRVKHLPQHTHQTSVSNCVLFLFVCSSVVFFTAFVSVQCDRQQATEGTDSRSQGRGHRGDWGAQRGRRGGRNGGTSGGSIFLRFWKKMSAVGLLSSQQHKTHCTCYLFYLVFFLLTSKMLHHHFVCPIYSNQGLLGIINNFQLFHPIIILSMNCSVYKTWSTLLFVWLKVPKPHT